MSLIKMGVLAWPKLRKWEVMVKKKWHYYLRFLAVHGVYEAADIQAQLPAGCSVSTQGIHKALKGLPSWIEKVDGQRNYRVYKGADLIRFSMSRDPHPVWYTIDERPPPQNSKIMYRNDQKLSLIRRPDTVAWCFAPLWEPTEG